MRRHLRFAIAICFWGAACGGARGVGRSAGAPAAAEDPEPLDISGLSSDAKPRFESERIKVVDSDNAKGYAFVTRDHKLGEDDFAERYHDVTGEKDIDQAKRMTPGNAQIGFGVLAIAGGTIGSIAVLAAGTQTHQLCFPSSVSAGQSFESGPMTCVNQGTSTSPEAVLGAAALSILSAVGVSLVVSGVRANEANRELSRADAERFARRYNRDLLRNLQRLPASSPPAAGAAAAGP